MPAVYHLGDLHPFEQALTLLLAFGPFVVLGIVIVLRRRADERGQAGAEGPVEGPVEDQRER